MASTHTTHDVCYACCRLVSVRFGLVTAEICLYGFVLQSRATLGYRSFFVTRACFLPNLLAPFNTTLAISVFIRDWSINDDSGNIPASDFQSVPD